MCRSAIGRTKPSVAIERKTNTSATASSGAPATSAIAAAPAPTANGARKTRSSASHRSRKRTSPPPTAPTRAWCELTPNADNRPMLASVPAVAAAFGAAVSAHPARVGASLREAVNAAAGDRAHRKPKSQSPAPCGLEPAAIGSSSSSGGSPRAWVVVRTTSPGRHGRFTIRWRVPLSDPSGPVQMRVALIHHHRLLASTAAAQRRWTGGAAVRATGAAGGQHPRRLRLDRRRCVRDRRPVSGHRPVSPAGVPVTATNSAAQIAASEKVAGGHSYTLAPLPSGRYTLRAGACMGSATVTAGHQTTADADCLYP